MEIQFVVTSQLEGLRLDCAVAEKNSGQSRSTIMQLIKRGEIQVSGKERKPSYRVHTGDLISGLIPDQDRDNCFILENSGSDNLVKENPISEESSILTMPFYILHEDEQILVINKKPGVVVHPAPGNLSGTLVNALVSYCPEIRLVGDDLFRPGIVHRLDKETSGVMVVAKEKMAFSFLKKEFMQRRVQKRYLAVVSGNIKEESGEINLPIGRHPVKRKMMSTVAEYGRYAETLWKVIQRYDGATLVEAELKTGRTHQVRVHFKAIGHPLVGDSVYGFKRGGTAFLKRSDKRGTIKTGDQVMVQRHVSRQMLHAWKLSFRHPWSGRRVEFTAPVPEDMVKLTGFSF